MKTLISYIILFVCITVTSIYAVPLQIPFNITLNENSSVTTGNVDFAFAIHSPDEDFYRWINAGNLSNEYPEPLTLFSSNGYYSVALGNTDISLMNPLPPQIFNSDSPLYLRVWVNGELLEPDIPLIAAPYSIDSARLQGLPPESFAASSHVALVSADIYSVSNYSAFIHAELTNETTARISADALNASNILDETTARISAYALNASNILDETTARISADALNASNILDETTARISADALNASNILDETTARISADALNASNILDETTARISADALNASNILDETSARISADALNASNILDETTARISADALNASNILDETTARISADEIAAQNLISATNTVTEFTHDTFIHAAGDTMSGTLTLNTLQLQTVTQSYVYSDSIMPTVNGTYLYTGNMLNNAPIYQNGSVFMYFIADTANSYWAISPNTSWPSAKSYSYCYSENPHSPPIGIWSKSGRLGASVTEPLIDAGGARIINTATPADANDAATKNYIDTTCATLADNLQSNYTVFSTPTDIIVTNDMQPFAPGPANHNVIQEFIPHTPGIIKNITIWHESPANLGDLTLYKGIPAQNTENIASTSTYTTNANGSITFSFMNNPPVIEADAHYFIGVFTYNYNSNFKRCTDIYPNGSLWYCDADSLYQTISSYDLAMIIDIEPEKSVEITQEGITVSPAAEITYKEQTLDNRFINAAGDTMSGSLTLNADPASPMHAATKNYVDTHVNIPDGSITSAKIEDGTIANADLANSAVNSAKIADGTVANADLANSAVTSSKISDATIMPADLNSTIDDHYINADGDTMTGPLSLYTDPSTPMHASTKNYVDNSISNSFQNRSGRFYIDANESFVQINDDRLTEDSIITVTPESPHYEIYCSYYVQPSNNCFTIYIEPTQEDKWYFNFTIQKF